jgi:serine/threonine protein kinase
LTQHHHREKFPWDSDDREIDPFLCESRAYCRLKEHGLCERGYVPDFYGLIKDIDPKTEGWKSRLEAFVEDPVRPNGVVIEYIPNTQQIDPANFSTARADQLRTAISVMHKAGVFHDDIYPRNVIVQEETDRAVWIDFDHAHTFPLDSRTESEEENMQEWMKDEDDRVHYLLIGLVRTYGLQLLEQGLLSLQAEDHKRDEIWWSWMFYYDTADPPGWTEEDQEAKLKVMLGTEYPAYVEKKRKCEEKECQRARIRRQKSSSWECDEFEDNHNEVDPDKGNNDNDNDEDETTAEPRPPSLDTW